VFAIVPDLAGYGGLDVVEVLLVSGDEGEVGGVVVAPVAVGSLVVCTVTWSGRGGR